jgi:hypothetical protein
MSAKHDIPRTRTPEDLERKYDLAGMKKTVEMVKDTLNKVNRNLTDFVNLIVGSLESLDGTVDGQIVAYFYNGVPGQETYPMVDWGDSYDNHIEDIYYDRGEGKVYTFRKTQTENGTSYEWVLTESIDKIRAMAIANATIDTRDNFRRIFLEQPIPPYDNGDLWLKTAEIYVCQVSKPSTEEYEEKDFILSTSYAGDTLAFKVGNELQVLKGTVLTIQENSDSYRRAITDLETEMGSMFEQTEQRLRFEIDSIKTTNEENSNAVNEYLTKFKKYFDFTDDGLIIGETGSPNQVQIDNDMIQFLVGGYMKITFDALGRGIIPNLSITEKLELLGIGIVEENGHIYGSFDEGDV